MFPQLRGTEGGGAPQTNTSQLEVVNVGHLGRRPQLHDGNLRDGSLPVQQRPGALLVRREDDVTERLIWGRGQ